MTVQINGTTGITTPTIDLTTPLAVADGGTGVSTDPYRMVTMSAVTASGVAVDFTGIPSWAKRVTLMLSGVSTNGASVVIVQIGDSGGIENTGYLGTTLSALNASVGSSQLSSSIVLEDTGLDTNHIRNGVIVFDNLTGNTWVFRGTVACSNVARTAHIGGSKSLSSTLDRIRVTTVNGSDTFDAGSINIMYEG